MSTYNFFTCGSVNSVVLLIMWVDNLCRYNVAGGGKTREKTYCRE